jgi:hypothetical protein
VGLVAVPDDSHQMLIGLHEVPGRQVRALDSPARPPVAWVTGQDVLGTGRQWAALRRDAAATELQPVLLSGLPGEAARPWDNGEFSEPQDTAAIDRLDAAHLLGGWWWDVDEEEYHEGGEELQAMLGPSGPRFPGLAPAIGLEISAEVTRRALGQYTRDARIGLVPAARPADVLARLGWQGACNSRTAVQIAAVLRSWEDRFGAWLLEVGFADIRLLVTRPPQTRQAAGSIAAEHFAFSDEAGRTGLRGVTEIAPALVNNPFWDFWWD